MHTTFEIILLDISNIFYRSFFATSELNSKGDDIGAVKTSMLTIQSLIKRYSAKNIVAVFDGKGGSKNKQHLYKDYKAQRSFPVKLNIFPGTEEEQKEKSKENFKHQLKILFYLLSYLPVKIVIREGFESDEIIGYLCKTYYNDKRKLIVSSDKDFHQLVDDNCYIYNLDSKEVVHKEYLEKKWRTSNTKNLTTIRTIVGDAGDNLYGIHRYGLSMNKYFPELFDNTTQISDIDEFKKYLEIKLEEYNNKEKKTSKDKTVLQKAKHLLQENDDKHTDELCIDIIKRNFDLMQLQHVEIDANTMMFIDNILSAKSTFDKKQIENIINKFNLESIKNIHYFWETFERNNNINIRKLA